LWGVADGGDVRSLAADVLSGADTSPHMDLVIGGGSTPGGVFTLPNEGSGFE